MTLTISANEQRWREIEDKHLSTCLWQHLSADRRSIVECLVHKATGMPVIVTRHYETSIPRGGSKKPWPAMLGCYVYAQLDSLSNSWPGLDKALSDLKRE